METVRASVISLNVLRVARQTGWAVMANGIAQVADFASAALNGSARSTGAAHAHGAWQAELRLSQRVRAGYPAAVNLVLRERRRTGKASRALRAGLSIGIREETLGAHYWQRCCVVAVMARWAIETSCSVSERVLAWVASHWEA